MSRLVPTTAIQIEAAIALKTLFVAPARMSGSFHVTILEDIGEGRVLAQVVDPHSEFHGTTLYPKLDKLAPLTEQTNVIRK